MSKTERFTLTVQEVPALLGELVVEGYQLMGPTVRDGAIVYESIEGVENLPRGWTERQAAGRYRLERRGDEAWFGYAQGPSSFKASFFVPRLQLLQLRRKDGSFVVHGEATQPPKLALIGVRACDLHAIAIQDRVFDSGDHVDPDYRARREGTFVIAVNCAQAGDNCFCSSMNTGPRATAGFDLAFWELLDGEHRFVVEVGSSRGADLLAKLQATRASAEDVALAEQQSVATAGSMKKTLDTQGIKALLYDNLDNARWDDVAKRCLSCANCTMVCPTCFCSNVSDTTDLAGETATRVRTWDSCFTLDHSHVHGGSVHATNRSRYRQWLVHKFASWIDQFGSSGCVGCGRCIAWCPVGIDVTEEIAAIRGSDMREEGGRGG